MGAADSTAGVCRPCGMVGVAQLVEHLVVVQGAAGSSPVTHPKLMCGFLRRLPPVTHGLHMVEHTKAPAQASRARLEPGRCAGRGQGRG